MVDEQKIRMDFHRHADAIALSHDLRSSSGGPFFFSASSAYACLLADHVDRAIAQRSALSEIDRLAGNAVGDGSEYDVHGEARQVVEAVEKLAKSRDSALIAMEIHKADAIKAIAMREAMKQKAEKLEQKNQRLRTKIANLESQLAHLVGGRT